MTCDFAEKFGIDTQEGIKTTEKIPTMGATEQYWSIPNNIMQWLTISENV